MPKQPKSGPKLGLLFFLEIAYNDNLQQQIYNMKKVKLMKKIWGAKYGPKQPKLGLHKMIAGKNI